MAKIIVRMDLIGCLAFGQMLETEREIDTPVKITVYQRKRNTALAPERLASLLFILQYTREIKRK